MKLKFESIKKASVPQRQVQQLDRVVQNFKPVSDHKHNVSVVVPDFIDMVELTFHTQQYFTDRVCRKEEGRRKEDERR